MSLLRLIARLDIKGPNVVKGINFEGLRVIGDPAALAEKYCHSADELLYIDTVASLYGRNQLGELLERTCEEVFIPVTVGGGIQSVQDARKLLNAGADTIAVNTAALKRPDLINELAGHFGSQAVVVSIEAKRVNGHWEAFTDNGRERTGVNAVDWAFEAVERGAGEILLTSIDCDGTQRGPDTALIERVRSLPVPVAYGGGIASARDAALALSAGADALAIGSALHYGKIDIKQLREELRIPGRTS